MQTLKVYLTPPQMEHKGAKEARQANYRAYVPSEPKTYQRGAKSHTRRVPSVRGYLFSEGKPAEAKYIKASIGTVTRQEITRLYIRTSKTQRAYRFQRGDHVTIRKGHNADVPAIVTQVLRGGRYEVAVTMLGKSCRVSVREVDMLHIHPHK